MDTWFLTGASSGLGAYWAKAILERGDNLVAAARNTEALVPLTHRYGDRVLTLELDVTDRVAVNAAIKAAEQRFHGIDLLVNNAGHMLIGAVEEVSAEHARAQMDVNFFGALWTTRAVLPGMRRRRRGRIMQVSGFDGLIAYPTMGIYHASKWALEAMSQSLAAEVIAHGIHVTLIEPIAFPTELGTNSPHVTPEPAYTHAREACKMTKASVGFTPGDPAATARAILAIADTPDPPLRVLFGINGLDALRTEYAGRLAGLERWDHISRFAQGNPAEGSQRW
ncbi:SDR family NAD(P)-dependent oxidoreductase [Actinoplanes sp. TBRC 11911]|nr:SDR family NAD(P)-dependent oxidoreductase [Actinoplanes sp. TBRC 11911]